MSIEIYKSEEVIQEKVKELAKKINDHYGDEPVVLLAILKGSFVFCADLMRHLTMPTTVEFMSISSYGSSTESSGKIRIELDVRHSIAGKRVLLVEDIVDTGNSLYTVLKTLSARNPKSVDIVTMLSKPSRRGKEVPVRFTGFIIPDEFVVGYGMDYAEKYRNLPYIGILK